MKERSVTDARARVAAPPSALTQRYTLPVMLAKWIARAVCLAASLHPLQVASSSSEAKTAPSARFLVVNERGKPLDLTSNTNWIAAVDERGRITIADCLRDRKGVCELPPLEPGRYWVSFDVAHRERVVRTVEIGAGAPTIEERVVLAARGSFDDGIQMEESSPGQSSHFPAGAGFTSPTRAERISPRSSCSVVARA